MLSSILSPRPEVTSGRIQGVIDPDRITDPKKKSLEAKPLDFARATFVSNDVRRLVKTLHARLHSSDAEVGSILFEGPKGQGKSHLITLAYHIVTHSTELAPWLAEQKLELTIPANVVVLLRKFTDFPFDTLWQVIGNEIGADFTGSRPPSIEAFRSALSGRKLVLLFDELESGIRAIGSDSQRQDNINFLQMISEESMRADSNVVLIASVYDGNIEPGLTLKRVKPTEIRFTDSRDRLHILFHRLFEKSPLTANPEIDNVVKSYANTWQRFGVPANTDYVERLRENYPFSPELIDVVTQRIPQSRGGFQGTRGALAFLAALVRLRGQHTNLLTLSDVALTDADIRTWLADLEPSQNLISCADTNLRDLAKLPLAERIASATLIASLAPSRTLGISEDELARQVLDPAIDYNLFKQTLDGFTKLASFFHRRDQNVYFDTRENAHAKVELRSIAVEDTDAWDRIAQWWRADIFGESDAVIFGEIDLARVRLEGLHTDGLRFVLSPRRLTAKDRHDLYFGLRRRNTVVLLEPRADKENLRTNKDILSWARKAIAAEALANATTTDADKLREFTKIATDQKTSVLDAIKKVNYAYVQIHRTGATPAEGEYTLEPVQPLNKQTVLTHLARNLFPAAFIAEHMQGRSADLLGRKVSAIEAEYRNTLGFPVVVFPTTFIEAINSLVLDGVVNLAHPAGTQHAGERVSLNNDELMEATFAAASARPVAAPTGRPAPSPAPGAGAPWPLPAPAGGSPAVQPSPELIFGSVAQTLTTGFCDSRQALREEVAARLDQADGKAVVRVRIGIAYESRTADMSTLPSFLRGSLTGTGTFNGEVTFEFPGSFNKAAVEAMMERLPDFAPGSAKVTLTLDS
jgi:hypothetical protein